MRVLFTLLLGMVFTVAFGQARIAPQDLVESAKASGKFFKEVSMFEMAPAKKSAITDVDISADDYDVLDLKNKKLLEVVRKAPEVMTLTVPTTARGVLQVELVKVDIFAEGFAVYENDSRIPVEVNHGVHYRGIVQGAGSSVAAVSFFNDHVMGLISSDQSGNLVLGQLEGEEWNREHVVYNDLDVLAQMNFDCAMPDDGPGYTAEELAPQHPTRDLSECVQLYFEVDTDVTSNKGGTQGAVNYVEGFFNEVAAIYSAENINSEISEIVTWTSTSPYSSSSSSGMLSDFQNYRSGFNGDLAQLVSYQASGGIAAGFSGLCNSNPDNSMSFSNIQSTYSSFPTYSWTVMVVAHEFGHLWGSRHTHACVWNGNNTAIDGCAGSTEGFCSNPGYPSSGGTIMSYCHLQSVGINFNNGFGSQPGNVIRNSTQNASCTDPCGGGGGGGSCTDNELTLTINLDNYPGETTWELRNDAGQLLYSGGPYSSANSTVSEDFCVVDDCFTFTINDSYGDGICCGYGNGSYTLTGDGSTLASGGNFGSTESTNFCIGGGGGGGGCTSIDLNSVTIDSYGGSQDQGTFQVQADPRLYIVNNAWKSIDLNYTVTPNTVLELDFGCTVQGEIHGIGFDTDNSISSNRTFRFYGTQNWGIGNYADYGSSFGSWKSYSIPVGQFYTGTFNRLFFVADHDGGAGNGNSYFRNIQIHEGGGCGTALPGIELVAESTEGTAFNIFPNPASDLLNVHYVAAQQGTVLISVYNVTGKQVYVQEVQTYGGFIAEQISIADLPEGSYVVRLDQGDQYQVSKFVVTR